MQIKMLRSSFIPAALILITAVGGISSQQVLMFGKCPKPAPLENFNISSLEGVWFPRYQYSRKFSPCTRFEFYQTSKTSLDLATFTRSKLPNDLQVGGKLVSVYSNEMAYMKLTWNMFPQIGDQVTVIAADKETYALLFFCTDLGLFHYQAGVIFMRNGTFLPREPRLEAHRQMYDIYGYHLTPFDEYCPFSDHLEYPEGNATDVKSFSFDDIFKHVSSFFG